MTYEDDEWGNSSLIKDLLRKQRVSVLNLYIECHNPTIEKKLTKKKRNKLDLVSANIQLSGAIDSVSTGKDTSGSKSSASSSGASEDCVLQEVGSDTSDDDNISLPKLASSSCSDSDSDVSLSVLC